MKKVLIVEDEADIAELQKDYLELSDFDVTITGDGIEGERLAMTGEYDILILDVILPGQDGYEICKKFREKYLKPVIMVTARKEDIDKIHGLGLGADDYMTKPFSPSELVARVKAHVTRYEALVHHVKEMDTPSEVIICRDLKLDKTSKRAFVAGEEKNLTLKEFELLWFLASNPNQNFSKEELFEEIWGPDSDADKATVTVHIKKIREKIEKNPAKPTYIETRWGIGYCFHN